MKNKRGLVIPVLLTSVLVLLVLMIVTGVLSYLSVYNESVNMIRQQNTSLVNRLEGWLNVRTAQLENNFIFLRDGDIAPETLTRLFTLQGDIYPEISMIMVGLPDGGFIHGGYWPEAVYTYAPSRIWYEAAAERPGEVFFLPPYWGPATQRFVFTVARTINDYDCSEGVIAMSMPFYMMQNFMAEYSILPHSYSFVLDDYGFILFHPDDSYAPIADGVFLHIRDVGGGKFYDMFDEVRRGGVYVGGGVAFVGETLNITGWHVITQVPLSYVVGTTMPTLVSLAIMAVFMIAAAVAMVIFVRSLRAAIQEVNKASLAKTLFIANMSHEIRTPMNSVVGFAELALDDTAVLSEKTQTYLKLTVENAMWLLQIVNDILDVSKAESGKIELDNVPFCLPRLLEQCEAALMPSALEKGVALQFDKSSLPAKTPVLGDPTRLRQIFTNLISNAVKFTNKGGVNVLAALKEQTDTHITVYFEFRDTGIGIPAEQLGTIFEPFSQADVSITRNYGGTGLGLSIVNNLLKLMGGSLSVESVPGEGSVFSFELTLKTTDYDKMPAPPITANLYFSGEVLVCEDNKMNRMVIGEHLRRIGLKYEMAVNGEEGVRYVKARAEKGEKYDLILMDIYMPIMDGVEASKEIIKLGADTPIIAMTANITDSDKETYQKAGMVDFIGKPFTSQGLCQCLYKFLVPASRPPQTSQTDDTALRRVLEAGFAEDNQNTFSQITEAVKNNDLSLAHRLAHSVKSSAGFIGKQALQQAAATVEASLKAGNVVESEIAALGEELQKVLETLVLPTAEDGKPHILIIDDTPMNLAALSYILDGEYKITIAKNGMDGIRIAKENKPDLILLDIIMPEMDGYEVIAALKADEETRDIPVIFVSGVEGDMDDKGFELGAVDYIHKPYTPNIARLRVANHIKYSRSGSNS